MVQAGSIDQGPEESEEQKAFPLACMSRHLTFPSLHSQHNFTKTIHLFLGIKIFRGGKFRKQTNSYVMYFDK